MKKAYKCLYNHDMGSIPQCLTPVLTSCDQEVAREQVQQFVWDVANTDVDAFLCCPTMLRRVLWRSEVDPHWQQEAPLLPDRDDADPLLARGDQNMYYRMYRYMMNGGDPVRDTFEAVKEAGMDFFISYRMNDWHYFELESDSLLLDTFWLQHPQYRVGEFTEYYPFVDDWSEPRVAKLENYLRPEVRTHYCDLLDELAGLYDLDGIELDFMRSPLYFPPSQREEGTQAMTEFVRSIRGLLDRHGALRSKNLSLCVSVPSTDNFTFTYPTVHGNWLKPGRTDGGCNPPETLFHRVPEHWLAT